MRKFIITYRKRYHTEPLQTEIDAYNFADAEEKFNTLFQEEDDLIIIQMHINALR